MPVVTLPKEVCPQWLGSSLFRTHYLSPLGMSREKQELKNPPGRRKARFGAVGSTSAPLSVALVLWPPKHPRRDKLENLPEN